MWYLLVALCGVAVGLCVGVILCAATALSHMAEDDAGSGDADCN
jgi:hypothetical protein